MSTVDSALAAELPGLPAPQSGSKVGDTAGDAKMLVLSNAGSSELEELNRLILLQEIALEKHSINFRHYHNIQGRWKGWRYFATQEANNLLTAGGLTYQLAERVRVVNHPYTLSTEKVTVTDKKTGIKTTDLKPIGVLQRARRSKLEAGAYPQLVGQCLAMAGSSLEWGINSYHRHEATRAGYECKSSIKQVRAYKDNLYDLMARRDAIISGGTLAAGDADLAKAEGVVLRDTTMLSLKEYEDFHTTTRRYRTLQDTLYVFDISRNATGVAGNIVNLVGYHEGSSYLTGPANVMTTISGALGIATPIASRAYAKMLGDAHRRLIQRGVGKCEPCSLTKYDFDRKNLQNLLGAKKTRGEEFSSKATALLSTYEGTAVERFQQEDLAQRDQRAGVRAAQENIIVGSINGTTKVCLGVTGIISGYGLQTANHRGNDLIIPGSITYLAGTWLSAGENIRLRVVDEMTRHRLGKQGLLPGQVLSARLKKLDQLESILQAAK